MELVETVIEDKDGGGFTITMRKPTKKDFDNLTGIDVKKFKKVLKQHAKEMKTHFDECGWDIDLDGQIEHLLYDLFDFHIKEFATASLLTDGLYVSYEGGRGLLKKKGYEPVYYHEGKNEIVIGRIDKGQIIHGGFRWLGQL